MNEAIKIRKSMKYKKEKNAESLKPKLFLGLPW